MFIYFSNFAVLLSSYPFRGFISGFSMQHDALFFANTVLIVSCIILSLIFTFLPLPDKKGLQSYRTSLRFLALSYFSLSVFTFLALCSENKINFTLVIATISWQSIFFFFSLITLFESDRANTKNLLKHLAATLIFIVSIFISDHIWGTSTQPDEPLFSRDSGRFTVGLHLLFLLFCMAQLIYFFSIFESKAKEYASKLADYYAETYQLRLIWVRYCFYGATGIAILVMVSVLFYSPVFDLITTIVNVFFYILFGLCYIQYPRTYTNIEPILGKESLPQAEEPELNYRALSWEKLKKTIINDQFFLRPEMNVEEMAQYLKIGRTTLSNYINKEEGMNFHAWINTLRIEEAKHLLLSNPDYTITQVAEKIGFSEPSNFSRQFKLITSLSPSAWKQKQWGEPKKLS
jgi:AraC-like DNA-binding protein